uniref:Uncharacterized protein n=1 Tax=Angiostrongylus cantonensis TaxID=6313 RepID=A0A158PCE6_ANGCA
MEPSTGSILTTEVVTEKRSNEVEEIVLRLRSAPVPDEPHVTWAEDVTEHCRGHTLPPPRKPNGGENGNPKENDSVEQPQGVYVENLATAGHHLAVRSLATILLMYNLATQDEKKNNVDL